MSKKNSSRRNHYEIILWDDDVNSFDHVIDCLMEICGHNYLQAVQCAHLVHHAGKCSIVEDTKQECEELIEDLREEGLTVTIEKKK